MPWLPDPDVLRGKVALVAGATRGAGRGIAAALGEPGAPLRRQGGGGDGDFDGSQPDIWPVVEAER